MLFPTMCTGYEETAGPGSPSEKWGAVHGCGSISLFFLSACGVMLGTLFPVEVWALMVPPWLLPSSQSSLVLSTGPRLGDTLLMCDSIPECGC